MKRALRALIYLYPKTWRNRYQNEFQALLDDVSPTWRTYFDVLGGGMKMQFKNWSAWKTIALCTILGVLVAGAFLRATSDRYVSTAVVRMPGGEAEQSSKLQKVLSRSSLTQIIRQEGLYPSERAKLPLETIIGQMKNKDIRIGRIADGVTVSFAAPDAGQAQRTTQLLAAAFVDDGTGLVLVPARPPTQQGPRTSRILLLGFVAGIALGVFFALLNGLKVWKFAAAFGFAGALLFALASYAVPNQFSSTAVMATRGADPALAQARLRSLVSKAQADALLDKMKWVYDVPAKLREHLLIRELPGTSVISIQSEDADQKAAQGAVQYMVWLLGQEDANSPSDVKLEIVDAASYPAAPVFPNRAVIMFVGLFLGLACAIAFGAVRHFRLPPSEAVAAS